MSAQLGVSGHTERAKTAGIQRLLMTVDAVGGVWRYAIDLSKTLAHAGVRVALFGVGPPPSPKQQEEAKAARLPLMWNRSPLDWMPGGLDALPELGKEIAKAAVAFDADVVQVNSLAYARANIGCPVIAVAHSCLPTWWRAVRGSRLPSCWAPHLQCNALGLQTASCVVAPSHSHVSAMRAVYGAHLDVRVVHNATGHTPLLRRRREPLVFAAGRWWDEAKNARTLDEAARLAKCPIVMAGSLCDPEGKRTQINHARALGPLDADTTREWMLRARALVAPSLYEPFGLAILEAAAASTPLVLADIPTFRELWSDAALFASPRDPAAFAEAVDWLTQDARLRRSLARRARARATQFTQERQADAMLEVYRSMALKGAHAALGSAV